MTPNNHNHTLLFTDIEASSALTERLGDRTWTDLLGVHNALVRTEVARHGGREVESSGDGFLLAFPGEQAGLDCAETIQRAFEEWARTGPLWIRIRIGVHTGEVVEQDGDVLGVEVRRPVLEVSAVAA